MHQPAYPLRPRGSVACQVCGRLYRTRRDRPPFVCSIECAERLSAVPWNRAGATLISETLKREVVPGKAWLLLEPLREPELSRRRALLERARKRA